MSYSTCEGHSSKVTDKRSRNYISFSSQSHSELLGSRKFESAHFLNETVRNMKRNSWVISKPLLHVRISILTLGIWKAQRQITKHCHNSPYGKNNLQYLWVGCSKRICSGHCYGDSHNRMYVKICHNVGISIVIHQLFVNPLLSLCIRSFLSS